VTIYLFFTSDYGDCITLIAKMLLIGAPLDYSSLPRFHRYNYSSQHLVSFAPPRIQNDTSLLHQFIRSGYPFK